MSLRIAIAALLVASSAHAGQSVALIAARGHVASPPPQAAGATRSSGACFWQMPGKMLWMNLYGASAVEVRDTQWAGQYELILHYGTWQTTHKIPKGEHISTLPNSILARVEECARGQ